MSFVRQEKDFESANLVLSEAAIVEGTRNVAHQIKHTLNFFIPNRIVRIIDIDPDAPFFACELARKLLHVSSKNTHTSNYALHSTESYIQFDSSNMPIITKASLKNLYGTTVIIVSAIPNAAKVKNLCPLLEQAGVRAIYTASLLHIQETESSPSFYAYLTKLDRHQLLGYCTNQLSNKSEIRTMTPFSKEKLIKIEFATMTPLFIEEKDSVLRTFFESHIANYLALKKKYNDVPPLKELATIFPDGTDIPAMVKYFEKRINVKASIDFVKNTQLLQPKYQVKADINQMVDEKLIPFLMKLGKKNQPIKIFVMKNGATHFAAYVLRRLGISKENLPPFSIHLIHGSRYGDKHVGGDMVWYVPPTEDMTNSIAIHLEDILEEGLTMKYTMDILERNGAKEQYIVPFADKPDCRSPLCKHIQPEFAVYTYEPDQFIGGLGLDYDEVDRCNFNVTFFNRAKDAAPKDNAEKAELSLTC